MKLLAFFGELARTNFLKALIALRNVAPLNEHLPTLTTQPPKSKGSVLEVLAIFQGFNVSPSSSRMYFSSLLVATLRSRLSVPMRRMSSMYHI